MLQHLRPLGLGASSSSSTQAQITAIAQQYGVDPNLALAVAKQESGYSQYNSSGGVLKSSAGAVGVMQLMPATAVGLGVDPNDQTQNITGGVKLLSQLLTQFNGNTSLALAAYNAGPGAVQQYGGIPPYPETQNYVSSIMANYQSMGGASSVDTSTPDTIDSSSSTDTTTMDGSATLGDILGSVDPVMLTVGTIVAAGILYVVFGRS